jgi:hypothetical protein
MAHDLSRDNCRPEAGQRLSIQGKDYVVGGKIGDGAVGLVRKVTCSKDKRTYGCAGGKPSQLVEQMCRTGRTRRTESDPAAASSSHPYRSWVERTRYPITSSIFPPSAAASVCSVL